MNEKMNNKIPCGGFYLDDTLSVDENGKLGVNRFVVTFTMSEDESIASDKTFAEIFDACKAGKKVSGVVLNPPNGWTELYVSTVNGDAIDFFMLARKLRVCEYVVVRVSRTDGNSLITGIIGKLEQAPQ